MCGELMRRPCLPSFSSPLPLFLFCNNHRLTGGFLGKAFFPEPFATQGPPHPVSHRQGYSLCPEAATKLRTLSSIPSCLQVPRAQPREFEDYPKSVFMRKFSRVEAPLCWTPFLSFSDFHNSDELEHN
jgi:hypothetical protein